MGLGAFSQGGNSSPTSHCLQQLPIATGQSSPFLGKRADRLSMESYLWSSPSMGLDESLYSTAPRLLFYWKKFLLVKMNICKHPKTFKKSIVQFKYGNVNGHILYFQKMQEISERIYRTSEIKNTVSGVFWQRTSSNYKSVKSHAYTSQKVMAADFRHQIKLSKCVS